MSTAAAEPIERIPDAVLGPEPTVEDAAKAALGTTPSSDEGTDWTPIFAAAGIAIAVVGVGFLMGRAS